METTSRSATTRRASGAGTWVIGTTNGHLFKRTTKAKPKRGATRAEQGDRKAKRSSGLDAAARALAESKQPMTCREIVDVAFDKGYWKSSGKTPHATIYSAIVREIAARATGSAFGTLRPVRPIAPV